MKLLLLTQTFPFGPGEGFLAAELDRLASTFAVTLVPAYRPSGPSRRVPGAVEVDTTLATGSIGSPGNALRVRRAIAIAVRDEFSQRRRELARSPRKLAFLSYYMLRGARAADWIRRGVTKASGTETLVYCYWSNAEAFGAALAFEQDSIPFVCRAHGGDLYERADVFGYLPFRSFIVDRARAVLTVSDHGRDHLRQRHPRSAAKIVTARLPIEIPSRAVEVPSSDPIVVASCSSTASIKRLPLIASAVATLAAQRPTTRFKWSHIGVDTASLLRMLAAGAPPTNLEIEGSGWISPSEVREVLVHEKPSVFVNLSSTEGLPVTIIEAMGLGIPVVATRAGGTGEFVDESVGAILPVEVSPEAAAKAIGQAIDRGETLRFAARSRVLDRCDPSRSGAAIVQHLLQAGQPESRDR